MTTRTDLAQQLAASMARALHVTAWAEREEESGRTYPGQELMDIAPDTTDEATAQAWRLMGRIEQANRLNIYAAYCKALKADGQDYYAEGVAESNARDFGHYLAMEALGHGVGWADDHEPHGLIVPSIEFCY
jgi:hypothetical protein